jgi:hypothetical protein
MAPQQGRQETPFMSFDPFGQNTPADPGPPEPTNEQNDVARDRVQWAAMFLIASSTLNLLLALFQVGNLIQFVFKPANVLHREMEEQMTKMAQTLDPQGKVKELRRSIEQLEETTPEQLKRQVLIQQGVLVFLLLLVALLGVLGGVRMYQLQSYSLAMMGSLASALPCLSPMTCCCGIGVMIGAWCVMVLLNPEVREVFRS